MQPEPTNFGGQINLTYLLFAIMIYVQTLTVVTLIMHPRYGTVKTILAKGLEQHPSAEQAFDTLADSYTGRGRFCRDTQTLLKH